MASSESTYDYIIIGGGTAGCVLASRLLERKRSLAVLVIEAGSDGSKHPHVSKPLEAALLPFSDMDFKYSTVPQKHLDGKPRYVGGAVAITADGWIRGDARDYDEWAQKAGDMRWSYSGLLPYFRRSEHHFDPNADSEQHGFSGPVYTSSVTGSGRRYPLRDTILKLWKRIYLKEIPDANNGAPHGVAELVENRRDGKRQLTSDMYPLTGARILTETMVKKIILGDEKQGKKVASGVELADGHRISVKDGGEVLVCGGAYRSPQILMLSGIGNKYELEKHGIPQLVDLPSVGKNFHDHQMIFRYWKLRYPEQGLAMGSPDFADPAFERGIPVDWLATTTVPHESLKAAIAKDEGKMVYAVKLPLLRAPRPYLEMSVLYAAFGAEQIGLEIPVDGTAIMSYYMACLPTSRGSITLGSTDPNAPPVIDPNYCATEVDRFIMCEGWRNQSWLMIQTPEGKKLVEAEILPEGHKFLSSTASDEQTYARIKLSGTSCNHPAASCSMGKVVDAECKVFGVEGLRVVDASVIPVPLAAHYQVPVFALAEQAVDMILAERVF